MYRALAALTGVLLGVALAVPLARGNALVVPVVFVAGAALVPIAIALVPPAERRLIGAICGLALALHVALAVVLNATSSSAGRPGFVFGDDADYYYLARGFALWLQGDPETPFVPPFWNGDAYLFGTWVYLEAAVFLAVGPDVLPMLVLNSASLVVVALLTYDIARRLFGVPAARFALVATAFFPSLMLWSALNLKDALALTLLTLALWALLRLALSGRVAWLAVPYATVVLLESLRHYLSVGVALLVPLAVLLVPRRRAWSAAALALTCLFLISNAEVTLGPSLVATLERTRQGMGQGARTGYVERPVSVQSGTSFAVTDCATVARTHYVSPNARLVILPDQAAPDPPPAPNVVYVRPCDLIVVGQPGTAAAPADRRVLPRDTPPVLLSESTSDTVVVARRTFDYLPIGLAHALFAPFPWAASRLADRLASAQTIVWDLLLLAAFVTLWRERRRWPLLAPAAAYIAGMIALLALAEGNVGTLFRHRDMATPIAIALAAPTVILVADRLRASRRAPARAETRRLTKDLARGS